MSDETRENRSAPSAEALEIRDRLTETGHRERAERMRALAIQGLREAIVSSAEDLSAILAQLASQEPAPPVELGSRQVDVIVAILGETYTALRKARGVVLRLAMQAADR